MAKYMKRFLVAALAGVLCVPPGTPGASHAAASGSLPPIHGGGLQASSGAASSASRSSSSLPPRIIVKLRDGLTSPQGLETRGVSAAQEQGGALPPRVAAALASQGVGQATVRALSAPRAVRTASHAAPSMANVVVVDVNKEADTSAICKALGALPEVEYAEPDHIVTALTLPNDPYYAAQWALQTDGYGIDAVRAWEITTGGNRIVVGVIDSGMQMSHPDLAANLWVNTRETFNGRDDDGNGKVDDRHGWDWVDQNNDPSDLYGHGTHVAGIIGAVGNNGVGVTGVSWSMRLMPLRVLNAFGQGYYSDVAAAIVYAVDNGAHVINLSLGGTGGSQTLEAAVTYALHRDVAVVAAAGNNGGETPFYPAAYDGVVSVAALDNANRRAAFSQYGHWVSVSAPGVDIISTWFGSSYLARSGTSMAAPFVTGTAALVLAAHPETGGIGAVERILSTAADVDTDNPDVRGKLGRGRVDAYAALAQGVGVVMRPAAPADAEIVFDAHGFGALPLSCRLIGPDSSIAAAGGSGSVPATVAQGASFFFSKYALPRDVDLRVVLSSDDQTVFDDVSVFVDSVTSEVRVKFEKVEGFGVGTFATRSGAARFGLAASGTDSPGLTVWSPFVSMPPPSNFQAVGAPLAITAWWARADTLSVELPVDRLLAPAGAAAADLLVAYAVRGAVPVAWRFLPVGGAAGGRVAADFPIPADGNAVYELVVVRRNVSAALGGAAAQVYPNPFRPGHPGHIDVRFEPVPPGARVEIIDLSGRVIARRSDDTLSGFVSWDGRDENARLVGSGFYVYRLTAEGMAVRGKLAVVR